ncbi:MAG: hypothetical protein RL757_927 [Bacteroidota bacterium]|jgi:hypothetical protein
MIYFLLMVSLPSGGLGGDLLGGSYFSRKYIFFIRWKVFNIFFKSLIINVL